MGVIRHRTDSVGKSAPGLGPPRSTQCEASGDCRSAQTVDRDRVKRLPRPLTQQGGWADSRLDGRGISLANLRTFRSVDSRFPDPFLGSAALRRSLPIGSCVVGPTHRRSADFLCAGRCITGGDSNPTCLLDVFTRRLVPGGLVAGRRLPPCPQLVASHGRYDPSEAGLRVRSLFLFRRTVSRPTT